MSNFPQNCLFSDIQMLDQKISKKQFSELFHNVYNNIIFSTLPYLLYKENSSQESLYKYNSGNCISLSYWIKLFLKLKYKIAKEHNIDLENSVIIGDSEKDTKAGLNAGLKKVIKI